MVPRIDLTHIPLLGTAPPLMGFPQLNACCMMCFSASQHRKRNPTGNHGESPERYSPHMLGQGGIVDGWPKPWDLVAYLPAPDTGAGLPGETVSVQLSRVGGQYRCNGQRPQPLHLLWRKMLEIILQCRPTRYTSSYPAPPHNIVMFRCPISINN